MSCHETSGEQRRTADTSFRIEVLKSKMAPWMFDRYRNDVETTREYQNLTKQQLHRSQPKGAQEPTFSSQVLRFLTSSNALPTQGRLTEPQPILKHHEISWIWSLNIFAQFCTCCFQGQTALLSEIYSIQCNWVCNLKHSFRCPFPPGGAGDCGGDHGGGLGGGDGKRVADGGAGGLTHCFLARSSSWKILETYHLLFKTKRSCCFFTFLFKMKHLYYI